MARYMDRKSVVIKKYENRRLYDTTNSRYINLEEVAQMVRDGYDVQVLDAATGEDLTRLVLTQIIVEHAKTPDSVFPLDMLRQMVAASGRATQENTLKYMKAVMDMYQNAYRAMAPPLNPFEFMRPPAARRAAEAPAAGNVSKEAAGHGSEVDELKQRVEELESVVSKLGKKKKSRRGSARRRS
jgi:polyhydroxyalkanoate synthesis repressor PhaR